MSGRILAIDDEVIWLQNFRTWIPEELAVQDSAATTAKAIALLRKWRYDLVLLDLSMDPYDGLDRSNRPIQQYLATIPEGTRYIIISGVVEKNEVRESYRKLNAYDVIYKASIDPGTLVDGVAAAIAESKKHVPALLADAKRRLTDQATLDDAILRALGPEGGVIGLYGIMDHVFSAICPISCHGDRPRFAARGQHVFGLVWSRQAGVALSIVMSGTSASEEQSNREISKWLGYQDRGTKVLSHEANGVRVAVFEEPSISPDHFDLPQIHV